MNVLGWIIIGTIVGLYGYRLTDGFPGKMFGAAIVGTLGAMLGGLAFSLVTRRDVLPFHAVSLLPAIAGAGLLVAALLLVGRRRGTPPVDPTPLR